MPTSCPTRRRTAPPASSPTTWSPSALTKLFGQRQRIQRHLPTRLRQGLQAAGHRTEVPANRPQTNGKAERVIRTLMDMWHRQQVFKDGQHRHIELMRFINFYNTVKPHKGLNNATPYEILTAYFNQPICKQP
jgi:Integrase core domain